MSTHTPGPWHSNVDEAHRRVVVRAGLTPLAELWMVGQPENQRIADARLIAAAPELLDALRDLVHGHDLVLSGDDALDDAYAGMHTEAALTSARAAIAKATQP